MAIPIVFPYKQETHKWSKLKYAVRSIYTYFQDEFEIWIIGSKPDWLMSGNVIELKYFKFRDEPIKNKNCNINNKFLLASNLFSEFIWVADDQYLLCETNLEELKKLWYLYDIRTIKITTNPNPWQKLFINTYKLGLNAGYNVHFNFEAHAPLYIESKYVPEVQKEFDIGSGDTLFKQAYGMVAKYRDPFIRVEIINQKKLGVYYRREIDESEWHAKQFLNFSEKGESSPGLKDKIKKLFPLKSDLE